VELMTLERKTPMKRAGRLSRTSKKRARDLRKRPAIRQAVFERDGGCLAQGVEGLGACFGGLTPHHVLKEGQGGEYTEDNLISLCCHHNDLLEADAKAAAIAKAAGFVASSHRKIRGCE
jgi:hypothetical protein